MKTKTTKLKDISFSETGKGNKQFCKSIVEEKNQKIFTESEKQQRRPTLNASVGESWLSNKGHKADALALGAEEGRDKLRKAAVRSKYPLTRRYPNGGIRLQ